MADSVKKPGWGAFLPRFSIPETFGAALSYEGQLHWFLDNWDEVAEFANSLEQPTVTVGKTEFPDTSNALMPSITNSGTDINAVLDFVYPVYRTRLASPAEWSADREYPIMTVVLDGNGNSYTSLQDVPAGTPLGSPEYWANTGSYDANLTAIGDKLAWYVTPDSYQDAQGTLSDSDLLQACIDNLTTGGVVLLNRLYTLDKDLVSNFLTDNPSYNHAFITFLGCGSTSAIDFGAYHIDGSTGSPHGGLRFINIDLAGTGDMIVKSAGMIRCVFLNCRVFGFSSVYKCDSSVLQDVSFDHCYFTGVPWVIDARDTGTTVYALSVTNSTIEKCGLINMGNTNSIVSCNITGNVIEDITYTPIVLGNGVRCCNISDNYFEHCTPYCIDVSNAFYGGADYVSLNVTGNSFVGVSAVLLPNRDLYGASASSNITHGAIRDNNAASGTLVTCDSYAGDNPIRFVVSGKEFDPMALEWLYKFPVYRLSELARMTVPSGTLNVHGVCLYWGGAARCLLIVPEYVLANYSGVTVQSLQVQNVGTAATVSILSRSNSSLVCTVTGIDISDKLGYGVLATLSF